MPRDYVLPRFQAPDAPQIDYARELNPQQFAAVTALPGPALVIAGAGAGKTRTLVYRVAFLIEQGIPPESILLLTFTNKAAREMMQRVRDLLENDLAGLWGGTFHSIGHRILRRHAEAIGYPPDFTILDREDAADLIRACLGDAKVAPQEPLFPKADVLAEIFSLAANMQIGIAETLGRHFSSFVTLAEAIVDLQTRYTERKRQAGVVDFDDLLALWLALLRDHPDVLERLQRRFQFLLVDEYQDTNRIQSDLVDLLAARHDNIMAVGDDSQSIYSWRGANFQNILRFPDRHPNTTVYRIETNYRSTPDILRLANAAIAPNVHQFPKELAAARPPGAKPVLVVCPDGRVQAAFVAARATELREEGTSLNAMAVLYRSHFHALELQLELTRRHIPFSITSGIRFFEQAHVKDLTAILKLVSNHRDEIAFKRLVRLLPGIGAVASGRLWAQFARQLPPQPSASSSVPDALPPPSPALLAPSFQALASSVPKRASAAWMQLSATLGQLEQEERARGKVSDLIALALDGFYRTHLDATYANARARMDDLDQLASYGRQFASLHEFLAQLALLTNVEAEGETRPQQEDERIRLTTVHQAKGLEFDVVFLIMLCDGLFPSARSAKSIEGEEEERRLFYVAITRARNELYLCYPAMRSFGAGGAETPQQPSRFLEDLPDELMETWNLHPPRWGDETQTLEPH